MATLYRVSPIILNEDREALTKKRGHAWFECAGVSRTELLTVFASECSIEGTVSSNDLANVVQTSVACWHRAHH
jgi:hypothetical protein